MEKENGIQAKHIVTWLLIIWAGSQVVEASSDCGILADPFEISDWLHGLSAPITVQSR